MAHADHSVNATEASQEGGRVYFNPEDVPRIERFFQSIVQKSATMFDGSWIAEEDNFN